MFWFVVCRCSIFRGQSQHNHQPTHPTIPNHFSLTHLSNKPNTTTSPLPTSPTNQTQPLLPYPPLQPTISTHFSLTHLSNQPNPTTSPLPTSPTNQTQPLLQSSPTQPTKPTHSSLTQPTPPSHLLQNLLHNQTHPPLQPNSPTSPSPNPPIPPISPTTPHPPLQTYPTSPSPTNLFTHPTYFKIFSLTHQTTT
ncbi:hypothetical protein Pcinc_004509 [Petrolisthes cinctipes]|uniref:Uncharacterized protein n=1 Tax=Petrolisthes cinctipes TaxID=88211 RepID=A0AAE1L024_PETCI|nr:hypothetical protein Pcinc_004509 [Petrolisthes cinctipes]